MCAVMSYFRSYAVVIQSAYNYTYLGSYLELQDGLLPIQSPDSVTAQAM
jgi:hypothetical protein